MQIVSGLFDHMVLQRTARNVSDAAIRGTCAGDGAIVVTVTKGGQPVRGLAGKRLAAASAGSFAAQLRGLRVGGPYDVTLARVDAAGKTVEELTVRDVLVGDVWLLGGQSNMQGVGLLAEAPTPEPLVRNFYMDDRWAVGQEILHNMDKSVDEVHKLLCGGVLPAPMTLTGVCPGLVFAKEMRRLTRVPQGTIACAHGGTSMAQWDPAKKGEGTRSLYGALCRRLLKNGGRVAGMIWYQGESDANADAAPKYSDRMEALITALRADTGDPQLPVGVVQISRVVGWGAQTAPFWNSIQDQERQLHLRLPQLATVPAIDLSLDDCIHISARGHAVLGVRLAAAMHTLRGGRGAQPPPIELDQITTRQDPRTGGAAIEVTFKHVVGALCAPGRPWGFGIVGTDAPDCIFDIRLQGSKAIIYTNLPALQLDGYKLHYGLGTNPFCNITDAGGRSLPVFGPAWLGEARAVTPFVQQFLVSPILPGAGKLAGLACPADLGALKLTPRTFAGNFGDRHLEIGPTSPHDGLLYYVCTLTCPEAMDVKVLVGYDGPVKAWVDGCEVFHDPNGVNPAWADKGGGSCALAAGKHSVVVALGTNNARAWGIHLRFQRLGVPEAKVKEGPWAYTLPTAGV